MLALIREISNDIITELDYYLKDQGDRYDYKSEFKSEKAILSIRNEVLKAYEKDKYRGRATVFVLPA